MSCVVSDPQRIQQNLVISNIVASDRHFGYDSAPMHMVLENNPLVVACPRRLVIHTCHITVAIHNRSRVQLVLV
jgi:hypothetical protein